MVYGQTTEVVKRKKIRVPDICASKGKRNICAVTCYDALFANIIEKSEVNIVLVGDSLGNVIQGKSSTIEVLVRDVEYHTRCVASKLHSPLLVADMPFGTAGFSNEICWQAAHTLIRAGAEAVKIEGASPEICAQISTLVNHGIPVMGHIGLVPQSVNTLGGYKVQGNSELNKQRLLNEAKNLVQAGCFSIVLELINADLARDITNSIDIPTIGIGSGCHCDGQILVISDLLGLNNEFHPKFVRRYASMENDIINALKQYHGDIVSGEFPSVTESFYERKD